MHLNHQTHGSGPPLVLIHGIGARLEMWDPVLDRLTSERSVLALDLPGFGQSAMPPPATPAGAPSLARLVAGFLDELGIARPHVAGNSLGGWIALELAKAGRARSATALSPAGFHNSREAVYQRAVLKGARAASKALAPRADRLMRSPLLRTATMGMLFAKPARIPPEAAVAAWRGLADAPWFDETLRVITSETFSAGGRIDVPVTIAWAQKDRLLLPRQAPRAVRAVPGARLVTLTGCGHVPTFDDPEQVAQVLLDSSR